MKTPERSDDLLVAFGSKVLSLLEEASYATTYKFALLLALIDKTREGVSARGNAPESLPTRAVAERVLQLYWPQSAPFRGTKEAHVLKQSGRGQAAIVSHLTRFRSHQELSLTTHASGLRALTGYDTLLRKIEWTVAEMPLPRLQRPYEPFIYEIDWDEAVTRTAYFSRERRIALMPNAGEHLIRLEPLLRPVVERYWGLKVGTLNRDLTDEARLHRFLFEPHRLPPKKLLSDLTELQSGRCFYCGHETRNRHIDHFIPWAHSLDEGIDNLVIACGTCNLSKSAHRAASRHVDSWAARLAPSNQTDLASIASAHGWEKDVGRTLGLARATYVGLPNGTKLWEAKDSYSEISVEREEITSMLAVAS